jgi:hypothetical protein
MEIGPNELRRLNRRRSGNYASRPPAVNATRPAAAPGFVLTFARLEA